MKINTVYEFKVLIQSYRPVSIVLRLLSKQSLLHKIFARQCPRINGDGHPRVSASVSACPPKDK